MRSFCIILCTFYILEEASVRFHRLSTPTFVIVCTISSSLLYHLSFQTPLYKPNILYCKIVFYMTINIYNQIMAGVNLIGKPEL
jgi:predicted membrane channel-forming protein YqfA (hemolysin III family)